MTLSSILGLGRYFCSGVILAALLQEDRVQKHRLQECAFNRELQKEQREMLDDVLKLERDRTRRLSVALGNW